MKKISSVIICAAAILSLAACGGNNHMGKNITILSGNVLSTGGQGGVGIGDDGSYDKGYGTGITTSGGEGHIFWETE